MASILDSSSSVEEVVALFEDMKQHYYTNFFMTIEIFTCPELGDAVSVALDTTHYDTGFIVAIKTLVRNEHVLIRIPDRSLLRRYMGIAYL